MLLLGTEPAKKIHQELKAKIQALAFTRRPALAMILVGNNPASVTYVGMKKKTCEKASIDSFVYEFPSTLSEKQLLSEINSLNKNPKIDGILVQLPLPPHIDPMHVVDAINPDKDVDGFHPINMGKLLLGREDGFIPCTPLGIELLLAYYEINLRGKHVVVLGRSQIVGKPLSALLARKGQDATVTLAHSQTQNLVSLTQMADVIVAAVGIPHFVKKEHLKQGAIVVDVGINRSPTSSESKEYTLCGDVDFESAKSVCSYITPVPRGVGPMTVASLLKNTFKSYLSQNQKETR